ncbi:CCA tRNA nucleotidyltransferase [Enterococcus larvae]|uniref:CCA tRNA nucleotidyltransferase n=1 Tax=Enterococcus larvae TaxID=2794352 RepID=UPI003F2CD1FD
MRLEHLPEEFIKASAVIDEIERHGFEAYFVGGSVRDTLLGKKSHDVDIATSAYPEEIKQIFKRTVDVGIDHGTVLVLYEEDQYEITTFRTESTYQDYRRPDTVTFVRSLEEDLKRRDFTINALALEKNGTIIDLFDGLADLKNGVIRAVGDPKERFHEDALRMMRGLRFASQLDFDIEKETMGAIYQFHSLLSKISVERITIEFVKLLLGENRQKGLLPFIETECYQSCPGLKEKTMALLRFSELPNKMIEEERMVWTMLLRELGIPITESRDFLKLWKLSNHLIHDVTELSYGLGQRLEADWQPKDLFRMGLEKVLIVEKMLFFYGQEVKLEKAEKLFSGLPITDRKQLKVTGNDLLAEIDQKPGKWLGRLIDQLEEAVINGVLVNEKQALIAYAKEFVKKE